MAIVDLIHKYVKLLWGLSDAGPVFIIKIKSDTSLVTAHKFNA